MSIFDPEEIKKHIVPEIKQQDKLEALRDVEDYFVGKCLEQGINISFDCTANESTYFKTLNYTTYAGMFIMHPLCFSSSVVQMYDAKADNLESVGHMDWLKTQHKGKYVLANGKAFKKFTGGQPKAVVVMLGDNLFAKFTDGAKYREISAKWGRDAVFKPHPNDGAKVLEMAEGSIGKSRIAKPFDDLYAMIEKCEVVYASHCSEAVLLSMLMGKRVEPTDIFDMRLCGSFSHINNMLFTEHNPVETMDSILASPKSGIIHPEVDKDWKGKIEAYFDYVLAKRELQKGLYTH